MFTCAHQADFLGYVIANTPWINVGRVRPARLCDSYPVRKDNVDQIEMNEAVSEFASAGEGRFIRDIRRSR
jgi:hypothetical protein